MKSRLFHHKDPRAASRTGAQSDTDTLSMLSVGAVTLTPEGEITEINARHATNSASAGGDFSHPLNISDILSVCHDRQDLLPGIFARLRERHRYGDLPPWSYIRLRNSNLKFYIEGRFVGRYDRRRQLRRIVFLFRNTEEEITRKFILGMACRRRRYSRGFSTSATTGWSSTSAGSPTWVFRRRRHDRHRRFLQARASRRPRQAGRSPSQNNSQER